MGMMQTQLVSSWVTTDHHSRIIVDSVRKKYSGVTLGQHSLLSLLHVFPEVL